MDSQTLPPSVPNGFQAAPAVAAPVVAAATAPPLLKKPWVAFVLAGFPGIGHVYDGLYVRGLTFFAIVGTLFVLTVQKDGLFSFIMAFFWIFNMLDAFRQAVLINYGYAQDLGLTDLPAQPKLGQGGLVAGVVLFLVGVAAFLERFFGLDLDYLLDFWPVGLMLIGAWMVVAAIRQKRRAPARVGEGMGSLLS